MCAVVTMMAIIVYLTHACSDIMLAIVYLAHMYHSGSMLVLVYLTHMCSVGSMLVVVMYLTFTVYVTGTFQVLCLGY